MKKTYGNRLTAMLLALCLVLGLAACGGGKKNGGDANQLSGTIYVPEFLDLDLELDYTEGGCCDGENVYIVGDISTETEVTDPETGETYSSYESRSAIYRIPLDGSGAAELENYTPSYQFENYDEGYLSVEDIAAGSDGTIWVTERVNTYTFNLPDDFDEEKDNKWEYQNREEMQLLRQLDSTGQEIDRIEFSSLNELLKANYINCTLIDDNKNLYVCYDKEEGGSAVSVVKDNAVLFTLDDDVSWRMVRCNDGRIAVECYTEDGGDLLRCIDVDGKKWGDEYTLENYTRNLYAGTDKYLFYYNTTDSLYGYLADTQQGEKLFSWSSADINADDLQFFSFLEDGRVVAMTRSYGRNGMKYEIAILSEADASVLADKTILTYATMYVNQQVRNNIIEFNRSNTKYRIEIRDYSEYNTSEDRSAGLTRLNAEIIGGNVPDILGTEDMPISRYAAKGYLEDLWTLIDADPDISRDTLMEHIFDVASLDGKLYQVFDSFYIMTAIGSQKVVGDRLGWTLADLQAALATMPEGCSIFGDGDTRDNMLRVFMAMNLDSYVDWEKGESHFDSDNFKATLEFCSTFPEEYESINYEDREPTPARIANGHQMLQELYLSGFGDIQMYEAMFGGSDALQSYDISYDHSSGGSYTVSVMSGTSGSVSGWNDGRSSQRVIPGRYISYVGFPREDGGIGSGFSLNQGMAISSTCKDKEGAWSFVRQILLPSMDDDDYGYRHWGFPSNKADFDKTVEQAMEVEYMTDGEGKTVLDDNGNPVQESKGGWGWDTLNIDLVATTQEEYDQVMELYNAVDSVYSYDESIFNIVTEQAGPYFSGDKSLEEAVTQINDRVKLYINENR